MEFILFCRYASWSKGKLFQAVCAPTKARSGPGYGPAEFCAIISSSLANLPRRFPLAVLGVLRERKPLGGFAQSN